MEQRLRRKLRNEEDAKLSREIRSVAPTSSNDIITTRATYGRSNAGKWTSLMIISLKLKLHL